MANGTNEAYYKAENELSAFVRKMDKREAITLLLQIVRENDCDSNRELFRQFGIQEA